MFVTSSITTYVGRAAHTHGPHLMLVPEMGRGTDSAHMMLQLVQARQATPQETGDRIQETSQQAQARPSKPGNKGTKRKPRR